MACSARADPGVGAALAHLRRPSHLLLPGGGPEPAALDQVVALRELSLSNRASKDRVAVAVDAIAEVLTGHADAGSLPIAQVFGVDKVPLVHTNLAQYACTTRLEWFWQAPGRPLQ